MKDTMTMRDKMIELVDKAKEEYTNDVTDHTETEYIVECLLNFGVVLDHPTEKDETERQIQTAKAMIEKMVSCYDPTEKGGEG